MKKVVFLIAMLVSLFSYGKTIEKSEAPELKHPSGELGKMLRNEDVYLIRGTKAYYVSMYHQGVGTAFILGVEEEGLIFDSEYKNDKNKYRLVLSDKLTREAEINVYKVFKSNADWLIGELTTDNEDEYLPLLQNLAKNHRDKGASLKLLELINDGQLIDSKIDKTQLEESILTSADESVWHEFLNYKNRTSNPDKSHAIKWLTKAAETQPEAMTVLAELYYKANGVAKSNEESANWLAKAADKNYPKAIYELANRYNNGRGVKKNKKKYFLLHKKASELGYVKSTRLLSKIYLNGWGTDVDVDKGLSILMELVEDNDTNSIMQLAKMKLAGKHVPQNIEEGLELAQIVANLGNYSTMAFLGDIYLTGSAHRINRSVIVHNIVEKDIKKAISWYERSYQTGPHYNAAKNLGDIYLNGEQIPQDLDKALSWYKKAASLNVSKKSKEEAQKAINKIECLMLPSAELFGVSLNCANRDELRLAMKNTKAGVISEDLRYWGDTYNTSKVLTGTSELYLGYDVDNNFAVAQYIFPAKMDTKKVVEVKNFVTKKYGKHNKSSGRIDLGEVSYKWILEGDITLEVSRGWPDTTTYLTFKHPQHYSAMKSEQARQAEAKKAKEYENQNTAF